MPDRTPLKIPRWYIIPISGNRWALHDRTQVSSIADADNPPPPVMIFATKEEAKIELERRV